MQCKERLAHLQNLKARAVILGRGRAASGEAHRLVSAGVGVLVPFGAVRLAALLTVHTLFLVADGVALGAPLALLLQTNTRLKYRAVAKRRRDLWLYSTTKGDKP